MMIFLYDKTDDDVQPKDVFELDGGALFSGTSEEGAERDETQGARNAGTKTYLVDRRRLRVPRNTVVRSRRQ